MERQLTYEERVKAAWASRKENLKTLLEAPGHVTPELGFLHEYGVGLFFFEAGTYPKQEQDAVMLLLCEEVPQEELRFYRSGKIDFALCGWFETWLMDVTEDEVAKKVRSYFSGDVPEASWF